MELLNEPERTITGEDASTSTFVSIYLLLLAFFIVLNAISNQRVAKAGAVMESLNSAFDKQFAPPAAVLDIISKPRAVAPTDEFLADVRGLLASVFEVEANFPTGGGNVLEVDIPLDLLFEEGTVALKPEVDSFVSHFASLALGARPGERREVEFRFGETAGFQGLGIRRAGRIARLLEERGIPSHSITIGVKGTESKSVSVVFRSHNESTASLRFTGLRPEEGE